MRSYGYINGEYAYILLVDVYIGVYGWLWWINCVQYVNICIYIFKCIYSDICCAYFICDTYIYIFPYIGLWWWTNHQYTMLFPGDSFMDVVNGAIMLVKQCHKPSPSHNHFYVVYLPVRVMGGKNGLVLPTLYPLVNQHSYWTWPLIVDLLIKNGGFP